MAKCKGCKAEIIWGRTERGKGLPLDPEPVRHGGMVDTGNRTQSGEIIVRPGNAQEENGQPDRYVNHFDTCQTPESFRRT